MRIPCVWFLSLVALFLIGSAARADGKSEEQAMLLKRFLSEFVEITPGKGDFPESVKLPDGENTRTLAVDHPYRINRYEVPQNLYESVAGRNPSRWKGPRNSVEMVDLGEAIAFCAKATRLMREQGLIGDREEVRLPTAREWEYACRAGATTAYSFGDRAEDLDDYGWHRGNAKGNDPPVGAKKPNAWGLYDMHGYLWEWRLPTPAERKKGEPDSRTGVAFGGAWTADAKGCRCDSMVRVPIMSRRADLGFRCVLVRSRQVP